MVSSDACIPDEAHKKLISLALGEMTRSTENVSTIQNHAMDILVAIGRGPNCKLVMEALMNHTKEGTVAHFMIMQCYGNIASSNIVGVVPFIKPIMAFTIPNLTGIKLDHIKQAHAYGRGGQLKISFIKILKIFSNSHRPF